MSTSSLKTLSRRTPKLAFPLDILEQIRHQHQHVCCTALAKFISKSAFLLKIFNYFIRKPHAPAVDLACKCNAPGFGCVGKFESPASHFGRRFNEPALDSLGNRCYSLRCCVGNPCSSLTPRLEAQCCSLGFWWWIRWCPTLGSLRELKAPALESVLQPQSPAPYFAWEKIALAWDPAWKLVLQPCILVESGPQTMLRSWIPWPWIRSQSQSLRLRSSEEI